MGQMFDDVSEELLEESRLFYLNKERALQSVKENKSRQSKSQQVPKNDQKQPFDPIVFLSSHIETISACLLFILIVVIFTLPVRSKGYDLAGTMPVTLQEGKGISGCNLGEDITEVYPNITGTINACGKSTIVINTKQSEDWEKDAACKIENTIKYIIKHRSSEIRTADVNNDLLFVVRRPSSNSPYIFSIYLLPYTAIAGYSKEDNIDDILFVSQLKYYGGNKRLWEKELM